jgi:hypothetical protein
MMVGLKNVIICVPTNVDNNVLAIRGEFKIQMETAHPLTIDQIQTELCMME